jgi:Cdc6-like AAA superfamily ATPase
MGVIVGFALGPLTLAAGLALAAFGRGWRRRWLWAATLPALGAAFLLWPFAHRHYKAALAAVHRVVAAHPRDRLLTVVHGGIAFHPKAMLLAAWPHLWPAWLATAPLTPLVALALLHWQTSDLDNSNPDEQRQRTQARLEKRVARRSVLPAAPGLDQTRLLLGYSLGGDNLLPTRRGRVYLPLTRLSHHLLVAGATGSGKTETVLRLASSLAQESDWTIIYIDGKGDRQNKRRFADLMSGAGRQVWLFPDQAYDGWRGTPAEISGRLLQLIDFADEGGGTYYRDLAVNTIRLACQTSAGPPRSSAELLARLRRDSLLELHPAHSPQAGEIAALSRDHLDGIRARYAAFFNTLNGALDGQTAFDQLDTAYFLLDGLRLKYEAGYLARFLVEEFTQWAAGRKPRHRRVLIIVDEFSAIAQAGQGLVDVIERTRGFGVAAVLCPQLAEGMGSPEAAARIIGSAQTILLHQMATPELFVRAGGTRRTHHTSRQLDGEDFTGRGSTRIEDEYRVDPNEVRRLKPGQCFAIGSGQAMKLQIAAAPQPDSPRSQHPAYTVKDAAAV